MQDGLHVYIFRVLNSVSPVPESRTGWTLSSGLLCLLQLLASSQGPAQHLIHHLHAVRKTFALCATENSMGLGMRQLHTMTLVYYGGEEVFDAAVYEYCTGHTT